MTTRWHCPRCRMEVPDHARVCAYCGAEFAPQGITQVRKWLERKGCVLVLGGMAVLFVVGVATTPAGQVVLLAIVSIAVLVGGLWLVLKVVKGVGQVTPLVSAQLLVRQYKDNAVAANKKYLGKVLEVTGKIKEIEDGKEGLCVNLKGIDIDVVECRFAVKERDKIATLHRKEEVTVRGTCRGQMNRPWDDVRLVNCKLVKPS
jgi:hypothetical protein